MIPRDIHETYIVGDLGDMRWTSMNLKRVRVRVVAAIALQAAVQTGHDWLVVFCQE